GRFFLEVRVLALAQHDVRELNACREYFHQHFAGAGFRHRAFDDGESVRSAEFTQHQDALCRGSQRFSFTAAEGAAGFFARTSAYTTAARTGLGLSGWTTETA